MRTGLLLIALAVAIALAAWRSGIPLGMPLAWMSVAFAMVGIAYVTNRRRVFGKDASGALRGPVRLLLLPYLVYAWVTWSVIRAVSREAPWNQLRPGLRIGRRPTPRELERIDFLVDLTAEFPRVQSVRGYLTLPILDAGLPDSEALDRALAEVPTAGITLIHCAQGHGRTAMFAVCLLIQREGIPLSTALEAVRAARPAARMNRSQMRFVEGFARRQTLRTG